MISKYLRVFAILIIVTTLIFSCRGKSVGAFSRIAMKLAGKTTSPSDSCALLLKNAKTEDEEIDALAFCANSNKEYADVIIPKVMSTSFNDVKRKHINDFKLLLKEAVEVGMDRDTLKVSADKWVEGNVKTKFNGVKVLIKKEFDDYIDSVSTKVDLQKPSTSSKVDSK
jgi:hypothetical protein